MVSIQMGSDLGHQQTSSTSVIVRACVRVYVNFPLGGDFLFFEVPRNEK